MSFELADVTNKYAEEPKLKERVNTLQQWLASQSHLPELIELQIILFLHSCCNEIEETKNVIQKYFTFRKSDLFQTGSVDLIRRTLASFFIGFLPKKTPEGFSVMLVKTLDPRPEKYVCEEHIKVALMIVTLYFHQYGPSNGLLILCDTKYSSFRHFLSLSVSPIKQSLQFFQEAAPTRIKGLHYLNAVPVLKHVFTLLKPMMKREIFNMIKVHSTSFETLYEYVPKECLPAEYGGALGPISQIHEQNVENIIRQFAFFKWHDRQSSGEVIKTSKMREGFMW